MNYRGKEKANGLLPLHVSPSIDADLSENKSYPNIELFFGSTRSYRTRNILIFFLGLWILVVHFFERTIVKHSFNSCSWGKWDSLNDEKYSHRVALIADPQIIDDHYYERTSTLAKSFGYFIQKISDNYIHRNHRMMQNTLDPDTVIFLGDLFEGGRDWQNEQWLLEYKKFNDIFNKPINRRVYENLVGNHDIGFQHLRQDYIDRFSTFFGPTNTLVEIGNHSFIFLDTISLSSSDEKIRRVPEMFLDNLKEQLNPYFPKILLTHVPLYRPSQESCGPFRESNKPLPIQVGVEYQTVITEEISARILEAVEPDFIFSGDDHDYCEIAHTYGFNKKAKEITVKSASMTNGIKYPAIQLLSLNHPYKLVQELQDKKDRTFSTNMCYLPAPYVALKSYVLLYVFTAITFLFLRVDIKILIEKYAIKKRQGILDEASVCWQAIPPARSIMDLKFLMHYILTMAIFTLYIYILFSIYYLMI